MRGMRVMGSMLVLGARVAWVEERVLLDEFGVSAGVYIQVARTLYFIYIQRPW